MTFIEKMKMQAKQDIKTIVLPESEDIRTLEATEIVLKEGFANIILIGNPQEINELAEKNNINLNGAQIVNPATSVFPYPTSPQSNLSIGLSDSISCFISSNDVN